MAIRIYKHKLSYLNTHKQLSSQIRFRTQTTEIDTQSQRFSISIFHQQHIIYGVNKQLRPPRLLQVIIIHIFYAIKRWLSHFVVVKIERFIALSLSSFSFWLFLTPFKTNETGQAETRHIFKRLCVVHYRYRFRWFIYVFDILIGVFVNISSFLNKYRSLFIYEEIHE